MEIRGEEQELLLFRSVMINMPTAACSESMIGQTGAKKC